jgi:hypothetical protein
MDLLHQLKRRRMPRGRKSELAMGEENKIQVQETAVLELA